jgi:hypothetical protein
MTTPRKTELIRRESIAELVTHRNLALDLYRQAAELIGRADKAAALACPSQERSTGLQKEQSDMLQYIGRFHSPEEFAESMRVITDRALWSHLVKATSMADIMDADAKKEFREQIEKNPPVCSVDSICATMFNNAANANDMFERGVVNAFKKLDSKYRTNDRFKVGKKIVIRNAFSDHGSWNHWADASDEIHDIERALMIIDGKKPASRAGGILGVIDSARHEIPGYGPKSGTCENEYFHIRMFINGNIHATFKRLDLIEEVNRIIARRCEGELANAA